MKTKIGTLMVHGASFPGTAMAPFPGVEGFVKGDWVEIEVIDVSPDEETPLEIRKALVGLRIATIFSSEQVNVFFRSHRHRQPGMRFAYAPDVIEALKEAGKGTEATALSAIASDRLDMYEFEPGTYIAIEPATT